MHVLIKASLSLILLHCVNCMIVRKKRITLLFLFKLRMAAQPLSPNTATDTNNTSGPNLQQYLSIFKQRTLMLPI